MIKKITLITFILLVAACGEDAPEENPPPSEYENVSTEFQIDVPEVELPPDPQFPVQVREYEPTVPVTPEVEVTAPKQGLPEEPSICPNPDDCEIVGEISVGHGEPVGIIQSNPNLKDPIAVWTRQLGDIVTCVEGGGTFRSCVEQSEATAACKSAFLDLSNKNNGADAAAFEAIFLGSEGPCTVQESSP